MLFVCRTAETQVQELTSTRAELSSSVEQLAADKEKLVPQLEQARWQNRQLEKKLEDMAAAKQAAEEVRPAAVRLLSFQSRLCMLVEKPEPLLLPAYCLHMWVMPCMMSRSRLMNPGDARRSLLHIC